MDWDHFLRSFETHIDYEKDVSLISRFLRALGVPGQKYLAALSDSEQFSYPNVRVAVDIWGKIGDVAPG